MPTISLPMTPHTVLATAPGANPVGTSQPVCVEVSPRITDDLPAGTTIEIDGTFSHVDMPYVHITGETVHNNTSQQWLSFLVERAAGGPPLTIDPAPLTQAANYFDGLTAQLGAQGFAPVQSLDYSPGADIWEFGAAFRWAFSSNPLLDRYIVFETVGFPSAVVKYFTANIVVLAEPQLSATYAGGPPPPSVPCRRLFARWPYVDKRPRVDTGQAGTRRYRKPIV